MLDLERINAFLAKVEESETRTFKPVGRKLKVGVDLGTAYIVLVVLDEENNPIACEKRAASVLRDGVVVDYRISYTDDFLGQMLEYGREYRTL